MRRVVYGVLTAGLMGVSGGSGAGDGFIEVLHAASAEARGFVQPPAPVVTEDSAGRLTVSWSPVTGATSYLFFVSRDGAPLDGSPIPFPSTATSITTGPDPLPAGTYALSVAGVVGGVIGAASPEATFAVGIPSAPGQPTAQVTGTTLTSLSWTAAAGKVTRYDLSVSLNGTPMPGSPFNMGPMTTIGPVPGLPPGTYLVSARAYNGATAGAASAAGSFVVAAPAAPGQPGTPAASVSGTTLTSLSWSAASGTVTAYKAYVTLNGTTLPGTPVLLGPSPAISNVGGLPTGTYAIRIAALNDTLEGPASSPVTFTVGGGTPGTGACTAPVRFTQHFIDPAHVQVVTPLGGQTAFGGSIAVRSYVMPPSALYGMRLPVYAPTDMDLVAASYYLPNGAPAGYQPEYSLFFDAGCSIEVQLYHIKGVVGAVASVVPTTASSSSAGQTVTRTRVAAGQQIGWYEGEAGRSVAFDFRVEDRSSPNVFINQSRFDSSAMATGERYAKCPYDYYSEPLKSTWMAKLGSAGGTVVPGTPCGTPSQGTPGTAHGMWFRPGAQVNSLTFEGTVFGDPAVGSAGQYMSQIAFTTDADGMVRIGGLNVAAPLGQMMVGSNHATWKKPEELTVGQTHCWTDSRQSVKVQLTSSTTLVAVVGSGSCDTLSLALGKTYER